MPYTTETSPVNPSGFPFPVGRSAPMSDPFSRLFESGPVPRGQNPPGQTVPVPAWSAPWSARLRPLWACFRPWRVACVWASFILLTGVGLGGWPKAAAFPGNFRVAGQPPGAEKEIQQAGAPAPAGGAPAPASAPALASPGFIRGRDGAEMVPIPAGEFLMGSPAGEGNPDEHPQHRVYLDAFSIDKVEVTNARYRKCVEAGSCTPPHDRQLYEDPRQAEHPVVLVDWDQSRAYCSWAGRRLPTEAEWEKAARGTDGRVYPWGNDFDLRHANTDSREDGYEGTAPVGSFPSGASPYGVLDMAGNASEWVADWYDENYYAHSPSRNPQGSDSGKLRVFRGGSWGVGENRVRAAYRIKIDPSNIIDLKSFRCAQDADRAGSLRPSS